MHAYTGITHALQTRSRDQKTGDEPLPDLHTLQNFGHFILLERHPPDTVLQPAANRVSQPKSARMSMAYQAHNLKVVGSNPTPATNPFKGLAISS